MKTFFITAGIVPARGASNSYQEALMEGLVARGHQVACLCTADVHRQPGVSWDCTQQEPYKRYSIFNAGIYPAHYSQGGIGSRQPRRDVYAHEVLRRAVLEIIHTEQPDVISIQSLFGLPFDALDEIRSEGIPVVLTAHDYFALCPTAHLFLPEEKPCRLLETELVCHTCCERSPSYNAFWLTAQLDRLAAGFNSHPVAQGGIWRIRNAVKKADGWFAQPGSTKDYFVRREKAIEFLRQLKFLHCISRHQAEVFRQICGPLANLRVLPLMPPTIEKLTPVQRLDRGEGGVSFTALNVNGAYKGSKLLVDAFKTLAKSGADYQLHVYGNHVPGPEIRSVFYHGRYQGSDLDRIAAGSDFCIVPSVWDETLGFVGIEMLARGVPLIVSARAGVSDFIRDGQNGYIFDPSSPDLLCAVIEKAMSRPPLARQNAVPADGLSLMSFSQHIGEMDNLFRTTLQGRPLGALASN